MPTSEASNVEYAPGQGLYVKSFGSNVAVLKHHDSDEPQRRFFASISSFPANSVVLASAASVADAGFLDALREACRRALAFAPSPTDPAAARRPPHQLWIAVAGLTHPGPHGRSVAEQLTAELGTDVLVPGGQLTLVPGGSIFVGRGQWQLFRSGRAPRPHVVRYPTPGWEKLLPPGPVADSGLITEPIPAGLRVRENGRDAPNPLEAGFTVPQSPYHPRLVLGRPDEPPIPTGRLAPLLSRLTAGARTQWELVPSTAEEVEPERMRELAERLGGEVLAATGCVLHDGSGAEQSVVRDEGGSWTPFPVSLRHSANGVARVALTARAPRGWVRINPLVYRYAESGPAEPAPGEVVARVVPGGLALMPFAQAGARGAADGIVFEQHRMTVSVGLPYVPVPSEAPRALRQLLDGLTPQQRARIRLLILGIADERMREKLTAVVGELTGRLDYPPVSSASGGSGGSPDSRSEAADGPAGGPSSPETGVPASDEQHTAATAAAPPHRPRTVSEPPAALLSAPAHHLSSAARPPAPAARTPHSETGGSGAVDRETPVRSATGTGAPDEPGPALPEQEPRTVEPEAPGRPRLVPAEPHEAGVPRHHRSTSEERSRFAQAAGTDFDEVLPTVNTVLATHPALRENQSEEAKADFVAVCLYTGQGDNGGNAVNRLLRTGDAEAVQDYVACLTSGLRRLPVHRGPSFRLTRNSAEQENADSHEPGAVLFEPGFLSATAADDLSTTDEHEDVVIWSHSARRVSLFGRGALPEEVVFSSASCFKVLSVEDGEGDQRAVLMRELRPDEQTTHGELDDADLAVLPKLRRALTRRYHTEPHVLSEGDQLGRMDSPVGLILEERIPATEPPRLARPVGSTASATAG